MSTPMLQVTIKNYDFNYNEWFQMTGTVKDMAGNPVDLTVGTWTATVIRSSNPGATGWTWTTRVQNADGTFVLSSKPLDHTLVQIGNYDYELNFTNDGAVIKSVVQKGRFNVSKGPWAVTA